MKSKLKIAIIADPELPVPPILYGGIERIIDSLVKELKQLGHSVTLFANSASTCPANKLYKYAASKQDFKSILANSLNVSRLLLDKPDIVHSFGRLTYLSALIPTRIPKIMSYQREPTIEQVKKAERLASSGTLYFTGCSNYITNKLKPYVKALTIYNSVDTAFYQYCGELQKGAPLVFLGRIEPIKGPHHALKIAIQAGRRLIIAGNVPDYARSYFQDHIQPFVDGKQITYIGPVNDDQKNKLLGEASALLMPIEWNEPFGIVMAEALACGTPVITLSGGAAGEIVTDGVNGYLCNHTDQMISAVKQLDKISRLTCRRDAEDRFSSHVMAAQYEDLYLKMSTKSL